MKKILLGLLCAGLCVCGASGDEAKPSVAEYKEMEKKCVVEGVFKDCSELRELFSVKELTALCEGGNALACGLLGSKYRKGEGVERDFVKAKKLLKQACHDEFSNACFEIAAMYATGEGGRISKPKVHEYLEEACDLGHRDACFVLNNTK